MQNEVLSVQEDLDVQVYAVWFNMFPGDSRERWPAAALPDPRVVHFWDEDRAVGDWYGARLAAMNETLVPGSRGVEPPLWDAYLVYGPDATWVEEPRGLRRWGRTVLLTKEALRESVEALAAERR